MVTTRSLEQVVEDALLEAGVSPERARVVTSRLGDDLMRLATKQDVEEGFQEVNERITDTENRHNQRMKELRDDLRREIALHSRYLLIAMSVGFGILTGLMAAIIALVA